MSGHTNLIRRGATYYVRAYTPKDLNDARTAAGVKPASELWRSLRTKDKAEAKRLLRRALDAIQAAWDHELRELTGGNTTSRVAMERSSSDSEIQAVVAREMARMRDLDENKRMAGVVGNGQRSAFAATREQIRSLLVGAGEASESLRRAVDKLASKNGLELPDGSHAQAFAQRSYARGLADLLRVLDARNAGDFSTGFADPAITAPLAAGSVRVAEPDPASPPIPVLLEKYLSDQAAKLSKEQLSQKRSAVRDFMEIVGPRAAVADFNKTNLRNYKFALLDSPSNARTNPAFKGMTFPQIVEANRTLKLKLLRPKTINSQLSHIGTFCRWLAAHGFIPDGRVTEGLHIAVDQRDGTRDSYTTDDLVRIFSLPVFRGCDPENDRNPGSHRVDDHRFWLPVISLFSGARLGEIAQLEVGDIKEEGDVPVFSFNLEGDPAKRLKNKYSLRVVPVHAELVQLGFLDYVAARKKDGDAQLFPLL